MIWPVAERNPELNLAPHPRILFVGWGRCGKDTCGSILHNVGPFVYTGSTSWQALPFMSKILRVPPQVAWDERHQHRQFWKDQCDILRKDDELFLIRLALQHGNVCTGLRADVEMDAAKASGLFDAIVWVERPGTPEDPTVQFTKDDCTDVLHNDGTLEDLKSLVIQWARSKGWLE